MSSKYPSPKVLLLLRLANFVSWLHAVSESLNEMAYDLTVEPLYSLYLEIHAWYITERDKEQGWETHPYLKDRRWRK